MNGTPRPQIQIIAPFTAAFEWMKTVLFSPFDLAKWLTIAFAAFIAGHWGNGFRFGQTWSPGDWKYSVRKDGPMPWADWDFTPWLILLIVVVVIFAIILGVVLLWVSSRGRFIFTDCVVKARGAIAEPWNEYRREGNSFFLFSLVISFCAFLLMGILMLFIWLLFGGIFRGDNSGAGFAVFISVLIVIGLCWLAISLFLGLVMQFMVPVMYRRRCMAKEAFFDVSKLVLANPGPFFLLVLFGIALVIGLAVVGSVIACMTCCIGGLPYISTVILLPAIVWLAAYKLLFIRQFGDAYDVWATVVAPVQTTEPLPPAAT